MIIQPNCSVFFLGSIGNPDKMNFIQSEVYREKLRVSIPVEPLVLMV